MSELTSEAIFVELAKLKDSKNRVISFADGHTIVPNSLLEEVWREAERNTEKRIIKLLSEDSYDAYVATDIYMGNFEFKIQDGSDVMDVNSVDAALKFYKNALIALIKGEK